MPGSHWTRRCANGLVKHYSGNRDRVATELLANAGVTEWEIENCSRATALTCPMLEVKIRRWNEPIEALAEGFVVDALLANWDVIGLEQDNILWQGETPIRLDQGGTFEFRAQGKPKHYGPEPVELETMLGPEGQARGRMAVTDQVIERGAQRAIDLLPSNRVFELVAQAPLADLEMADRIGRNLNFRIAALKQL